MRAGLPRLAITLLCISGALGTHVAPFHLQIAGFSLFLFRQLVILLFVLALWGILRRKKVRLLWSRSYRTYALALWVWICWGVASLWWTPDPYEGIAEVGSLVIGLMFSILTLQLLDNDVRKLGNVGQGWILAFLVTGGVAVWELYTGNHLPGYWAENSPEYARVRVACATFDNPNDYGAFLLLTVPFIWLTHRQSVSRATRAFCIGLQGLLPVFMFSAASRTAIAGLIVFVVAVLMREGVRKRVGAILSIAAFVCAACVLVWYSARYFSGYGALAYTKLYGALTHPSEVESAKVRLNLILNGFWATTFTGGLGLGAGGFESWLVQEGGPFPTGNIINAHNLWVEIMSQYGLGVLGLFVLWLVQVYRVGGACEKRYDKSHRDYGFFLKWCVLLYLLAGFISSSFLKSSVNLMYLGSVAGISCVIENTVLVSRACLANLKAGTGRSQMEEGPPAR